MLDSCIMELAASDSFLSFGAASALRLALLRR
jgi:hypothetical protein